MTVRNRTQLQAALEDARVFERFTLTTADTEGCTCDTRRRGPSLLTDADGERDFAVNLVTRSDIHALECSLYAAAALASTVGGVTLDEEAGCTCLS